MNIKKYVFRLFFLLPFLLFVGPASAGYVKYTYQTPIITILEGATYTEDGSYAEIQPFRNAAVQFEIELIIEELKYELAESGGFFHKDYENPVVKVTASNLFDSIIVDSSHFFFEAWIDEGNSYHTWHLYIDITDDHFPGTQVRHALLRLNGAFDDMTFHEYNRLYSRCGDQHSEWDDRCWRGFLNSSAFFVGQQSDKYLDSYPGGIFRMFGERIPFPEPLSFLLLLCGVVFLFSVRQTVCSKVTFVRCTDIKRFFTCCSSREFPDDPLKLGLGYVWRWGFTYRYRL